MDLASPKNCLTFNLLRAGRALSRRMEAEMQTTGLSIQQFSTLGHLAGHGPLPITRLAHLLGTERTTLTRNIRVLKDRELVAETETEDRRAHVLSITDAGREALAAAMPLWQKQQSRLIQALGRAESEHLITVLQKLAT